MKLVHSDGVIGLYCLGAAASGLLIVHLPELAGWVPIAAAVWVWHWPRKT